LRVFTFDASVRSLDAQVTILGHMQGMILGMMSACKRGSHAV
jgi:hypothetical protein